jgi:Tfp pilus assembly protein PilF
VYGVVFAVHFGMICLLPSVALLWYHSWSKGRLLAVPVSLAAITATSALLLWLCGYSFDSFIDVFLHSEKHFLPLRTLTSSWQAYTLFSLNHLIDLLNLQLLLSPFAVILLLAVVSLRFKSILSTGIVSAFLAIFTACGLLFTFVVNSDLGVSRDWDLLASFQLGVPVVSAFLWISSAEQRVVRHRLMALMIGISLLHTAAWIGVNADVERSIARFTLLQDGRFWGKSALAHGCEVIGGYYRDTKEYAQARDWFVRYLKIDSTNSRIWASVAQASSKLGDEREQTYAYEKAVEYGAIFEAVYLDLGSIYAKQRKFDEAIEVLKKGLAVDSSFSLVNESMGEYSILAGRRYREALPYFLRVIRLNPQWHRPYYAAGDCYQHLGEPESTKYYWGNYLRLRPDAPEAAQIRAILQTSR